jgi:2,3-bisphosphoglycerate-independent phosphoglycerate mutase
VWLWGEGSAFSLPKFCDKYNVDGAVISAVDLVKGIGLCAGLENVHVIGATGNIHTNFKGKADAALNVLKTCDFVYIHVEAPDECGHRAQIHEKVRAIELIDEKIIGPIMAELDRQGTNYSILIMPDHPTPLELKDHTDEPVPFAYFRKSNPIQGVRAFDEKIANTTGIYINNGHLLMGEFIKHG